MADEILSGYCHEFSTIDIGNVFFAAMEYKLAYDNLQAQLDIAMRALSAYKDFKIIFGFEAGFVGQPKEKYETNSIFVAQQALDDIAKLKDQK